jgi:hypothetical protein
MPSINKDGKFIISAGEVASYTLCPEAWRLMYVANKATEKNVSKNTNIAGIEKHKEWSQDVSEARHLIRGIRILIYLLGFSLALLITMLSK